MHKHGVFLKGMRIVGLSVLGLVTFAAIGLIFGLLVQLLWNWLMPEIFKLPFINYWQAFGLVILGKLIFGNFGPHSGHHKHHHRHPFPEKHFARHHYHYFHRSHGCEDAEWQLKGGWRNWEYYEDWWREEGKTAFENYIGRVTNDRTDSEKNSNI